MKFLSCLALLALSGCFSAERDYSTPETLTVSDNAVQISPDSKFIHEIHPVPLGKAPGGERKLRTVGQMVAVANSSGDLTKNDVSWVTLDTSLVRSLGLHLSDSAPVGYAYGVTSVSSSYRNEIHDGEKVEVYRYGLRQNSTVGTVVSIREDSVIFLINKGQDWYPGTNCQVEFPLIEKQAVALSPLSMLHEGLREFVMKEVGPNRYVAQEITVVNETRDQVYALGDLVPGDRVIEGGAILLKPLIHQIIKAHGEVVHVR